MFIGEKPGTEPAAKPSFMEGIHSEKEFIFLQLLSVYGNETKACAEAGVERKTMRRRKSDDPEFRKKYLEAMDMGNAALEDEARRRAFEGCMEPIYYQGAQCGEVRKYSDTLLIALLKANMPEKFMDRTKSEVTGAGGVPFQADVNIKSAVEDAMKEFESEY